MNTRRGRRAPFLTIVGLWTLWGLWSAQQSVLVAMVGGRPVDSRIRTFALALSSAWFWALLTPALMWTTRRYRDRLASRGRWIAAHLGTFLLVHVLDATVYSIGTALAGTPRPLVQLLFSLVTFNALTYIVVVGLTTALDSGKTLRARRVREAELEAQLALAQFHALRAQLHPHFLFNALNAISALMHTDVERADRMLARVSELLRIAIDTAAAPEIRLADELDFAERYLEVERMRFGERLEVRLDIAGETYDALVPNMLLQPLVENAVRHGVAPHSEPGRVEIRARRVGDQLSLVVHDTGRGIPDGSSQNGDTREGVGLSTTRARLKELYGSAQELTLVNLPGGFETRVTLPLRRSRAAP